jgi:hypothetical protein
MLFGIYRALLFSQGQGCVEQFNLDDVQRTFSLKIEGSVLS